MHRYAHYPYNATGQPPEGTVVVRAWFNRFTFPMNPDQIDFAEREGADMSITRLLDGYVPGDMMECTFTIWLPSGEENVFEEMYAFLNGDDRPNGAVERSLSIGDVLQVGDDIRGAVARAGFEPVSFSDWLETVATNEKYLTSVFTEPS